VIQVGQDLSNLAKWDRDNVVNINVLPRIYTLQCFSLCMLNGAYKHLLYTTFHNSYTWCAFDLLKNKGLDRTTSVVLCLISKLFLGQDKLGAKGLDKNLNSCPPLNHGTTFCPPHKLSKIPK
jgi:hypothetical protein